MSELSGGIRFIQIKILFIMHGSRLGCLLSTILVPVLFIGSGPLSIALAQDVDFQRDVVPIFEEHCWHCHGEDEQESGLRLDQRGVMLKGGDSGLATVVPGHPEKSLLMDVVNHVQEDLAMPPDEDKIPAEQIATLRRWISQGAIIADQMDQVREEKSDHWSFQPVVRPKVPELSMPENGLTESSQAIDAFLRNRLTEKGLDFSEPADPVSLIRRASIVLIGLTPTPRETETFVQAYRNHPEEAYSELIDRLLASPHFGERWAQHWLDVIRWAETNGSEANLYRKNAWIYRDYVVRSFNEDRPYDQFVRDQIAGDSFGTGEATGFLVAGPHVPAATVGREPSAIRQARADRMDEIMQTLGASVMGVTIGCARCHNHKFDPITIKDYYALTGIFQDVEFGSRRPEFSDDHPRKQRGQEIWRGIAQQRNILRQTGGWEEDWGAFREIHFEPVNTKAVRFRFKMKNLGIDELELFGPDEQGLNLAEANQGTTVTAFPEDGAEGRNPIKHINDGEYGTMAWRANVKKDEKEKPWVVFEFESPQTINRLKIGSNREYYFDTDYLDKKPYLPRYEFDIDILEDDGETWRPYTGTWFINKKLKEQHPERVEALKTIQKLIATLEEEGPRPSFVGRFIRPATTHVLLRGSPESPRDEVMPAGPALLDGDLELTNKDPGRVRRKAFANWITRPENPLTSRVMVNRIWHHVFGQGIVTTTSDFGKAGAQPSHPELLDWLAAEFVNPSTSSYSSDAHVGTEMPWSVKRMIRMMVLSQAFRQSSLPGHDGLALDAGAVFLWRYPPKRVEAEVIRDSILQASGNLDRSIGGRGYRIHNEKKTYAQWEVVDNYGPDTWRRMIYQERMRRVDDGIFTAFDFPDCGQVRAKRPVSTTPLQALNLMNSDFVLDQSKRIAERALRESDNDPNAAVQRCFALILGRTPDSQEWKDSVELAQQNQLDLVCRALINSNEFAFVP